MMKRVCCFTDCLVSGGAQRQLVGLACLLKKRGYDVSVVLYYDIPFYKPHLDAAGVPCVVVGNTKNPIKRLWLLFRYWRNNASDVMIAYQETPSLISCLMRPIMKWRRLIVSERNTTQTVTFRDKIRFWLWRFADVIVPNSYAQTNFIKVNQLCRVNKVVTITNFTDIDVFVPESSRDMGHPNNIIAVVASMKPEKNFRRLAEAIQLVKRRHSNFHVNWYGIAEPYIENHNQILRDLEVDDVMTVYPMRLNVADNLRESDFFVLPSLFEGFPNALCEAMSCGLPVACSAICDNPRIVRNGDNGFLFDPLNVEEMSEAILRLLSMPADAYKEMATKNRTYAECSLSEERFVEKYIRLIEF